jgi:hypothetical protein
MKTIVLDLTRVLFSVLIKCKRYCSVPHIFLLFCSCLLSAATFAQSNERLAEPVVWLRGDLGTVSPTFWSDKRKDKWGANALSGEGPSIKGTINFNKALLFDGVNNYMQIPYSLENLPSFTVIAVYQPADTTERGVFGTVKAVSRKAMLSTKKALGPDEAVDKYSESDKAPILNTVIQNWAENLEIGDEAHMALGSAGKESGKTPFKGLVAEFIVFDRALSFLERLQTETYLAIKYGIQLLNVNYVSSTEDVLWHTENNSEFSNRITGIGRDDAFLLHQKQAISALDSSRLLVMSAGRMAASNADNVAQLNNADFLLWGDNNAPLVDKNIPAADKPVQSAEILLPVLERKWLMNVSGATANQIATEVQLNLNLLPKSEMGYWLVIDRSGKGDFNPDKLEYVPADSISADSIAYFRNIKWDTDHSGTDLFSFAKARQMLALIDNIGQPLCPTPADGSASMRVVGGKAPFKYELSNATTGYHQKWDGLNTTRQELLAAGDYTLQVTDADGYTSIRTFTLDAPEFLFVKLGEDRQLKEGETITLDATVSAPDFSEVTYAWTGSNGFSSTDARVQITEPGMYKVVVTNKNGCTFEDKIVILGPDDNFLVYPTVLESGETYKIAISLQEPASVKIKIYDLKGHLLQEIKGDSQAEYHFKGKALGRGVYMVVLETSNKLSTKKLFVY